MADDIYDALSMTREFHAAATNQVYISGPRHRAPESFATRNEPRGYSLQVQIMDEWVPVGGIKPVEIRGFDTATGPLHKSLLFADGTIYGRGPHYGHGGKRMTAFGVEICVTCGVQR